MILPPLDPLGDALRTAYERARHDIDWQGHPLMAVYLDHSRVKVGQTQAAKRGWTLRRGRAWRPANITR